VIATIFETHRYSIKTISAAGKQFQGSKFIIQSHYFVKVTIPFISYQ